MIRQILIAVVVIVFTAVAQGDLVTVKWDVTITSKYDYAAGTYDTTFQPFTAPGSHTFENTINIKYTTDYGTTTSTYFGGIYDTKWDSPTTQFVEDDPYGTGIWSGTSFASAYVSDYPSTFIEEAAAIASTYSLSPDKTKFWNHHIEIRADKRSPSRGGLGTEDYSFTPDMNIAFYESFIASGEKALFNESFQLYDYTSGTSFGGYSWWGYAIITGIEVVPVPSAVLLATLGLTFSGGLLRRRRGGYY